MIRKQIKHKYFYKSLLRNSIIRAVFELMHLSVLFLSQAGTFITIVFDDTGKFFIFAIIGQY